MTSTPIYYPAVAPSITERAGTRGGTHTGIDLAANLNDPVLAPFAGQIVYAGGDGARAPIWLGSGWLYPNGEGRTVDIRRSDGLIARLGHLNGYAVSQGDWVTAGQVIGYAGTTGYSTGVHIHWELRWDRAWVGGNWIDPLTLNPQTFQEDDMYENADRNRDKITYDRLVNMEKLLISHDKRDQITYKRLVNMEGALIRTLAGVTKLTTIAEGAKDVSPEVLAAAKQIAADVEKALQDEFAAIPGAVADEQSKRLKE